MMMTIKMTMTMMRIMMTMGSSARQQCRAILWMINCPAAGTRYCNSSSGSNAAGEFVPAAELLVSFIPAAGLLVNLVPAEELLVIFVPAAELLVNFTGSRAIGEFCTRSTRTLA